MKRMVKNKVSNSEWEFADSGIEPKLNVSKSDGSGLGASYLFLFQVQKPSANYNSIRNLFVYQDCGKFASLIPGSEMLKLEILKERPVWYRRII